MESKSDVDFFFFTRYIYSTIPRPGTDFDENLYALRDNNADIEKINTHGLGKNCEDFGWDRFG